MLDHLRARIEAALSEPKAVLLITHGPSGLQASRWPCEAQGLRLFVLLPAVSDHLVNVDASGSAEAVVVTDHWRLEGRAVRCASPSSALALTRRVDMPWSLVVEVRPTRLHLLRPDGWGDGETLTIDE